MTRTGIAALLAAATGLASGGALAQPVPSKNEATMRSEIEGIYKRHQELARAQRLRVVSTVAARPVRKKLTDEERFARLGTAQNGRIDKKDFRGSPRLYRLLDPLERRGYVTLADLKSLRGPKRSAIAMEKAISFFERFDKNRDGNLTVEEAKSVTVRGRPFRFEEIDANRDKIITLAEFASFVLKNADARRAKRRR
jgi:Ca2+-binding EF-hand superfamily protein